MTGWDVREGDCVELMAGMEPESIDAVICDPPYGLSKEPDIIEVLTHWLAGDDYKHRGGGFMGRDWDSFVPGPSYWRECFRVMRPGAHLLAFGGTRTYDLLVIAIRLAGFEIRDRIVVHGSTPEGGDAYRELGPELDWMYGSGFP
jgi:DNA modification methylase